MTLNKIVAVVLAGGVKRFSFKEFYYQLEDLITYKEWYFRVGYKSLKRIKKKGGIEGEARPMVEYILHTLKKMNSIDRVLVVGPEKEMRDKIDPEFFSAGSKFEIIQQKDNFGQNVKEGYERAGEKFVLFVTADSPTTKEADEILKGKGIPVLPDILANSGGVIASYVEWRRAKSGSITKIEETYETVDTLILESLGKVTNLARTEGVSYREMALAIAVEQVIKAMEARGWL